MCIEVKIGDYMSNTKKIMKIVEANNGVITSKEVDKLGIHRQHLSILVKKGLLEKVERGIYISLNTFEDTMFNLQTRFNKGIFSHNSALFLHGLTDQAPLRYSMTFPTSYNITKLQEHNVITYRTSNKFYHEGIVIILTSSGNYVRVYNIEKTLCDILRGNSKLTKEEVINAFKIYSRKKDKNLNVLYKYAKLLKVENKIKAYMEVLI